MGEILNSSALRVWLVRLPARPLTTAATDDLLRLLDEDTRNRVMRFQQPERDRTLVGHATLRRLLAPELGVAPTSITLTRRCANCGSAEHGKPSLARIDGVEFSLSHSADLVAIAIAGVPVGVDVEQRSSATDWAGIRFDVFGDDEWSDDASALTDLWSRKEAAVKATGLGMSATLAAVNPVSTGDGSWRAGRARGWDLSVPSHAAAVAVLGETAPPSVVELGLDLG